MIKQSQSDVRSVRYCSYMFVESSFSRIFGLQICPHYGHVGTGWDLEGTSSISLWQFLLQRIKFAFPLISYKLLSDDKIFRVHPSIRVVSKIDVRPILENPFIIFAIEMLKELDKLSSMFSRISCIFSQKVSGFS